MGMHGSSLILIMYFVYQGSSLPAKELDRQHEGSEAIGNEGFINGPGGFPVPPVPGSEGSGGFGGGFGGSEFGGGSGGFGGGSGGFPVDQEDLVDFQMDQVDFL